jgi:hypothetical protein
VDKGQLEARWRVRTLGDFEDTKGAVFWDRHIRLLRGAVVGVKWAWEGGCPRAKASRRSPKKGLAPGVTGEEATWGSSVRRGKAGWCESPRPW